MMKMTYGEPAQNTVMGGPFGTCGLYRSSSLCAAKAAVMNAERDIASTGWSVVLAFDSSCFSRFSVFPLRMMLVQDVVS